MLTTALFLIILLALFYGVYWGACQLFPANFHAIVGIILGLAYLIVALPKLGVNIF